MILDPKWAWRISLSVVFLAIFTDQALKMWVKTHFVLGEEFNVIGNWFILHFTENNGMAFGMELGGSLGKMLLSLFRIVAVFGIAYYLVKLIRTSNPSGLIISISLIFAGAIGNILDSIYYGKIFSDSYFHLAEFLPAAGGYATWLHGKVVDMLYFPILKGFWPNWIPFIGGDYFVFFQPVFNLADTFISTGVLMILIFQKRYFKEESKS